LNLFCQHNQQVGKRKKSPLPPKGGILVVGEHYAD
jgi:hypothetical protein